MIGKYKEGEQEVHRNISGKITSEDARTTVCQCTTMARDIESRSIATNSYCGDGTRLIDDPSHNVFWSSICEGLTSQTSMALML